jgi:hypothetical protein
MNSKLLLNGLLASSIVLLSSCDSTVKDAKSPADQNKEIKETRQMEKEELVAKGEYLVTIGGCNDCHTPKIFNEKGMMFDSSRMLSGHPAKDPVFTVQAAALQPTGGYNQMSSGLTSWAGPWGVSFTANLTPDSATGLGSWPEETFIKTLRTGKHLGQENGRDILPPMPWFNLAKAKEEDLQAIYAYLRSIPAINNRVPAPIPPNMVQAK